jgi:hypothetical protein
MAIEEKKTVHGRIWWQIGVIVGALLLDAIGVGGFVLHEEVSAIVKQQSEFAAEEKADNKIDAQLDKRISILEAKLAIKEGHAHSEHLPGTVCVCISNNSTNGFSKNSRAEICEFGEQCDQNAILACQTIHKGSNCQPLY